MSIAKALIVVDTQVDFCESGALAVPGGNEVAERIRWTLDHTAAAYKEIVFTKDWHNEPPDDNGGHFALSGEPDFVDSWPVHCVSTTKGAMLHPELGDWYMDNPSRIFYKGMGRPDYSGFQGVDSLGNTLNSWLNLRGIGEVHIVGIAGDYCVRQTALDAKRKGYLTYVLPSMIASVGGAEATKAMQEELDSLVVV